MDPYKIIEQFYDKESELYRILVVHSEQVRDRALKIAERHPELNIDKQFVLQAAMLHDIGIIQTDAAGIKCYGTRPYIEHGYLGAQMLRQLGYERHALVCERHTGTGLTVEAIKNSRADVPLRDMQPVSIEEQVICYADKFYSKTHLDRELSIERALEKFKRHPEQKNDIERFMMWVSMFE